MLRVKDIMTRDVVTVTPGTTVRDAANLLAQKGISGVPVVDGARLVGVFSESDILRSLSTVKKDIRMVYPSISPLGIAFQEEVSQREMIEAYGEAGKKTVGDVMTKSIVTVDPEATVNDAIIRMTDNKINRLPVLDKGVLVGIVTRGDIIKGLAQDPAKGK
jgi:CBS domain-containing protein